MEIPVTGSPVVAFVSNNCWSLYNFRMHLLRHYVQLGYKVIVIAAADEYTKELTSAGMIYYDVEFRNSAVDPLSDLRVLRQLKNAPKGPISFSIMLPNLLSTVLLRRKLENPQHFG
jgi:hypothetical protein